MKTFRDSNDNSWTVFEVRRRVTESSGDLSFLPSGFNDGWLCFEMVGAKKRLIRYPERWREFTDAELEYLLGQAQPAPRTSFRVPDDLAGDSPLREL
jgi:hypothetical protein